MSILHFDDDNYTDETTMVALGVDAAEIIDEPNAVLVIIQSTTDETDTSQVDGYHFNLEEAKVIYEALGDFLGSLDEV